MLETNVVNIEPVCEIAIEAGNAIIDIYNSGKFGVETKDDDSPLTLADKKSHEIISHGLQKLYPEIPVISEESKNIPYEHRKPWSVFWLVDPLDGTKEFIKRNGEFTVNIALIKDKQPVAGIIYVADSAILYYGEKGKKAYKRLKSADAEPIEADKDGMNGLVAVRSRSHGSEAEEKFYSRFDIKDTIQVGSSLKFCMVAEGKAHLYYRHNPTMEWDTAAGHAIVDSAGGFIKNLEYNKPVLKNSSFIVSSFHV
ncbi:3'(2'),5'-bisphosphate nucleotidase CysQ [candidate division KSB1 bacterium]|nr:3'(2'),5'-bisphosphate nucleotidase CysQ [candidate division KSB1 bacterium]MBL7095894.1 3'(2'),5'-bisphosphate nucleotidase CysQ [candidate division KSB1 bacterium]